MTTGIDDVMMRADAVHRRGLLRSLPVRARLLWRIGVELEARVDDLIAVALAETHLDEARLRAELARTIGQLHGFTALVGTGTWSGLVIDTGPPDLRRGAVALGPVVVFGAASFPFSSANAGGDTAAALAAGCPVVVKGHPDHPETAELVAGSIAAALAVVELPDDVVQLVVGGNAVGEALVVHPAARAVAFTGSYAAGQAVRAATLQRADPIPVFAEMSSQNPVFVLPQAWAQRADAIVTALAGAVTMGVGQVCTRPGVVAATADVAAQLAAALGAAVGERGPGVMLSDTIAERFTARVAEIAADPDASVVTGTAEPGVPGVALVPAEAFAASALLHDEIFGPFTFVVACRDVDELLALATWYDGQLAATIHAAPGDDVPAQQLLDVLVDRVGRVVWGGTPNAVTVSAAMHHGGPFPVTFDSRATSVGSAATERFRRPVTYQDVPDDLLPAELRDANPYGLERRVDGRVTTDPVQRPGR